jgi:excisionase family DNA binding protein
MRRSLVAPGAIVWIALATETATSPTASVTDEAVAGGKASAEETSASLYSVREVADGLGVHPETVRRLINEGRLDAVRMGRVLRISQEALAALLDAQRIRSETRRQTSPPEEVGP